MSSSKRQHSRTQPKRFKPDKPISFQPGNIVREMAEVVEGEVITRWPDGSLLVAWGFDGVALGQSVVKPENLVLVRADLRLRVNLPDEKMGIYIQRAG